MIAITHNTQSDIDLLKMWIEELYMPAMALQTPEAKEIEMEIRKKIDGLKAWATRLVEEKIDSK